MAMKLFVIVLASLALSACMPRMTLRNVDTTPIATTTVTQIVKVPTPVPCIDEKDIPPTPVPTFTTQAQIDAAAEDQRSAAAERDIKAWIEWARKVAILFSICTKGIDSL